MVEDIPYVIVNVAASLDGRISLSGGKRVRLSSPEDKARVHKLRAECDAVAVGINTIINDDPKLYVNHRYAYAIEDPIRVVFDTALRIPPEARILKRLPDGRHPMTIVFTSEERAQAAKELGKRAVVEGIPLKGTMLDLGAALHCLYSKYSVKRLMIEGGGMVIGRVLAEGLWNEMYLYLAPVFIGSNGVSILNLELDSMLENQDIVDMEPMGEGVLLTIKREEGG